MSAILPGSDLERWVEERLGPGTGLTRLTGDASTRSYLRAAPKQGASRVLMVTGESFDPESMPWLSGVPAPRQVPSGSVEVVVEDSDTVGSGAVMVVATGIGALVVG